MQTGIESNDFYDRAQRRIGWLTLALGLSASLLVGVLWAPEAGVGLAIGTVLAWVNYRWLEGGVNALARVAAAQAGAPAARVSPHVYLEFVGRYVLIGVVLYVMVSYFAVPLLSVLLGLLALGAAALAEGLYEVFSGTD